MMKSVGQILQETRNTKRIELEDVSRVTRIRPQFLRIIEADDYSQLPSGAVARGFIRNYSEYLGLNSENVLAVFRRDFVENPRGQIVPRGMVTPASEVSFWTPRTTVWAVVSTVLTIFLGYLLFQYHILTGPPELLLTEPKDNVATSQESILVSGRTDPEATLLVNDQQVVLDKGGQFSFRVSLNPGENKVKIVAVTKSGQQAVVMRSVTLK